MARRPQSKTSGRGGGDARKARVRGLRGVMRERGVDSVLITSESDVRYFSGFEGDSSYLLVGMKGCVLITDFRFEEDAEAVRGVARVAMRSGAIAAEVGTQFKKMGAGLLGLQGEHATLALRDALAKSVGARRLRVLGGLAGPLRMVKDDGEVRAIRRAIRVQEEALLAALPQFEAGMTELEACAVLEYELKARGSTEPAFGTIVAARANGSKPHAVPGKTKLSKTGGLLIDFGATVDGYRSDMTRVFTLGRFGRELSKVYDIVEEAFHAGVAAVRPGVTGAEVDAAARGVIKAAGYGDRFGHSLGHGIGLDVHEGPRLSSASDDVLAPGMVVTVEPGIYLPGVGGVRLENDILVTERGRRDLCTLPMDRGWAEGGWG